MAPYVQEFLKGLGTGGETWSGVMTQYCQGISLNAQSCPSSNSQHVGYPTGGALAGVWVDNSAATPSQSTGHQLAQEAINAAAHFNDYSSSSQYVIVSPTGTSPDGFATSNWCAWHDYTGDSTLDGGGAVASPPGDPPVAFTNLPYVTDAGASCGENFVNSGSAGTLDGVSIIEGHEYAETITDTFPAGGWTDSLGNEDGDKCAWDPAGQSVPTQNIALTTGTFAVQPTWANDDNSGSGGCEVSHPIVVDPVVRVGDPGTQTSTDNAAVTPLQMTATDSSTGSTCCTWSATGLPAGLSIDSSTGEITGTPTSVGSSSVTVTATDSKSAQGSTGFTWTITKRSTTTSVSCAPNPVAVGVQTTCTATVTDTSAGTALTPGGNVTISPGGTCTLSGTGNQASCTAHYTPTATGTQDVTASYGGDTTHSTSSSSAFVLTESGRSTSTTLSCDTPSLAASTPTTCTATVADTESGGTPTTPTGSVDFTASPSGNGSFSATSCSLTSASCQVQYTPSLPGPQTVTASYQGDTAHAGSSSSGFGLTVGDDPVTVANPGNQSTTAGASVDLPITAHDTNAAPLTYSANGLPSGLSIDRSTGMISGIATTPETTSVTVKVTDSSQAWNTATFDWKVTAPPSNPPTTDQPPSSPPPPSPCPAPTGKLSGKRLGLAQLGMTRARVRAAYSQSSRSTSANKDAFCLAGTGINVGYPSAKLLSRLTSKQRSKLRGRVIWVTTANLHYSVDGIAVGARLAAVERAIKHGRLVSAVGVRWYLASDGSATLLLKIQGGVVRELGIASAQLIRITKTRLMLVKGLA